MPSHNSGLNQNDSFSRSSHITTMAGISEFDLTGHVVVLTGGTGGLDIVQAEALVEVGAIVTPLPEKEAAADTGRQENYPDQLYFRNVDVRDNVKLNEIVADIAKEHGRLDGCIAAAGINHECPAIDYPKVEVDRILGINVMGCFLTAQAVARQMKKFGEGGSIVMIASMSAHIANKGSEFALYNSSKAAVLQLARNLAMEWGPDNIRINTISPGYIVTEMVEELFKTKPERKEQWAKENMLGRLSMPAEYRGATLFLLSKASSFMTGADLKMDGGHSAW
ncbi:hypothetical protein BJ878DRAFT_555254 [Calycina marina]|uniref:Uncharacterized protein n=1 Tax=Calycina marina TaxID=1763456 RepID=A0A9P7Z8V3_9HELO|nr:hypothetical protein BJ878DRAFT_555254 [Calycina marina]